MEALTLRYQNEVTFNFFMSSSERGQDLYAEFIYFLKNHSPVRFSKNLRKMLMEYLMLHGIEESAYFKELMFDLDGLFYLLDAAAEEIGSSSSQKDNEGSAS
jgi:hypothetical protein